MTAPLYKGFTRSHLEWAYRVRFTEAGVVVPYFGNTGDIYREKLFSAKGKPLQWLGASKPQIPYGLETLAFGGDVVFLTEGESCAWALRAAYRRTPVIAIPGASSWRDEWKRPLQRFSLIYLSFDADAAGDSLLEAVWPSLPWARRVTLPEGSDTRDVLQLLGGADAYERLVADADYLTAATRYIFERGQEVDRVAA